MNILQNFKNLEKLWKGKPQYLFFKIKPIWKKSYLQRYK